jgi:hypothetical protein
MSAALGVDVIDRVRGTLWGALLIELFRATKGTVNSGHHTSGTEATCTSSASQALEMIYARVARNIHAGQEFFLVGS